MVSIFPANLTDSDFTNWERGDVRNAGVLAITTDQPRSGDGSLKQALTASADKSGVSFGFASGDLSHLLSDISLISYEWFRDVSSTNPDGQHPSIKLFVDGDGSDATTNDRVTMIFEGAYNGRAVAPEGAWVTDDATTANFWVFHSASSGYPGAPGVVEVFDKTLAEWIAESVTFGAWTDPIGANAVVRGVAVESGSGWNGVFTGYVDNVNVSFANASDVIANFEVAPPTISIAANANANRAEGTDPDGTAPFTTRNFGFTVSRTGDTSAAASVDYAVTGSGANPADGGDFFNGVLPSGTVNFTAGQASRTLNIRVSEDLALELDEGFTVTLSNPSGDYTLGTGTANGLIQNDDQAFSIAGLVSIQVEGNTGQTGFTFTVSRSGLTTAAATIDYAVSSAAADATDFGGTLPSGSVSFLANETSKTVTVNVSGDTTVEADEPFTVTLSNPSSGTISQATADGEILNDDSAISIAALSADKAEGNAGQTAYTFTVSRSGDTTLAATVDYAVSSAAANATDFGGILPSGQVSFAANEASKTLTVNVAGDIAVEADEPFTVTLSNPSVGLLGTATADGTIRNDDSATGLFPGTPGDDNYCGQNGGDQATGVVNDLMTGQAGNDCFSPKGGLDTVFGGLGTDLLDYSAVSGVFGAPPAGAVINLASGVSTDPWGNLDFTLELENAIGTEHADWLVGTEGANVLTGLGGADTAVGLGGADTIDLGSGADQGYGYAGNDSITGGPGNDTVYGMEGADLLTGYGVNGMTVPEQGTSTLRNGETDNDLLVGGIDNDTLVGGPGNDSLFGETGDDLIDGGAGGDVADGSQGNDTIVLGDGANFAFAGGDNDTVTGGADADVLMGQAGNDVLTSLGGADNVLGGDGNDTLAAGEGADNVLGEVGNDSLDAGGGADVVNGGSGVDQMAGGAGSDVFVISALASGTSAATPDVITDFQGAGTSGAGDQDYLLLQTASGNLGTASFTHLGAGLWQFADGLNSTFVRILDGSASPITALLGPGFADTSDFGIF